MQGEPNLSILLASMAPVLNEGKYVFCAVKNMTQINPAEIIFFFKEAEAITIIVKKTTADKYHLKYLFVAAWLTLTVHSSLEAVGLTAAFSTALGNEGISCNVVAAFYHDHIFVAAVDAQKALDVLKKLAASG